MARDLVALIRGWSKHHYRHVAGVTFIVDLAPDRAAVLLEHVAESQRPKRASHVEKLADDIVSGRFFYNGVPFCITQAGDLIDGQHRCEAIVRSGQMLPDQPIVVVRDERTYVSFDTGQTRTRNDFLKYMSPGTKLGLAAQSALLLEHCEFSTSAVNRHSKVDQTEMVMASPFAPFLGKLQRSKSKRIPRAPLAAAVRCMRAHPDAAVLFFQHALENNHLIGSEYSHACQLAATYLSGMAADGTAWKDSSVRALRKVSGILCAAFFDWYSGDDGIRDGARRQTYRVFTPPTKEEAANAARFPRHPRVDRALIAAMDEAAE